VSPVIELSFREQVLLTLLDKAVLGSVVVGVGFLANRALEARKARQSLRATLAEERMPKIAAIVGSYSDIMTETRALMRKLFMEALHRTQLHTRFITGQLTKDQGAELVSAVSKVLDEHKPEVDAAEERIENAMTELGKEHFWIGSDCTTHSGLSTPC
jgi:hypothetical protein